MVEVTLVVLIVSILSAVAAAQFIGAASSTVDSESERLLVSVAGAQDAHFRSRGGFATSIEALGRLSTRTVTLTAGASSGPAVVSISELLHQNEIMLGLAVLSVSGHCVTLLVPEPGSAQSFSAVSIPGGNSCDGTRAAI